MSTFAVELRKMSKMYTHPDADKIELGQVEGMTYQFVVQKDLYRVGDEVVYFPIDSLLPQDLILQQNISNFMAGKDKNRIKTCRLRGEISQGYVAPVSSIKLYLKTEELPADLTTALGVTKYIAPEIMIQDGKLVERPPLVEVYDIEACDRHPNIVDLLMDQKVVITEKLEGANMGTTIDTNQKIYVFQRENAIENLPDQEEHGFWKIARNEGFIDAVRILQKDYFPECVVTIRSEALGSIQGNYYNFKKHTSRFYDIEVNGKPLDFPDLEMYMDKLGLLHMPGLGLRSKFVPIIACNITLREWLNGRTLQQASNGKSALIDRLREGIVIKPMKEQYIIGFGRLFLKQRDPIYLDKTGM